MGNFPIGFFILAGLIYIYFTLQYFFTQLFYSKYNIAILFLIASCLSIITFFISSAEEKVENVLYCAGFFYYALLLLLVKKYYRKLNSFLVKHGRIKPRFSNKGFTYVSYHKGIFDRGNSWDEELATEPSWLDHLFSWSLIILPFAFSFIGVVIYRNGRQY
jgi:hypothetical protein